MSPRPPSDARIDRLVSDAIGSIDPDRFDEMIRGAIGESVGLEGGYEEDAPPDGAVVHDLDARRSRRDGVGGRRWGPSLATAAALILIAGAVGLYVGSLGSEDIGEDSVAIGAPPPDPGQPPVTDAPTTTSGLGEGPNADPGGTIAGGLPPLTTIDGVTDPPDFVIVGPATIEACSQATFVVQHMAEGEPAPTGTWTLPPELQPIDESSGEVSVFALDAVAPYVVSIEFVPDDPAASSSTLQVTVEPESTVAEAVSPAECAAVGGWTLSP